ncbi:MAG: aminotransferase class III-fold pyridoxal phosphate-dependent enzyme, partial [Oscillospiraceae bacterium]
NTAAIMVEFIQGEGGVNALKADFVNKIADLCKDKDILLIADEVQTGVGRTGTFLASEGYGVTPDITTLAKGLGGGLPIGAVLFGEKCKDVLQKSDHGSTFGGNPIVCAGACEVLKKIDDRLLCEVQNKGEYIKNRLEKIEGVQGVSGKGLMIGVLFNDFTGREVVDKCIEKGVLFLTAKNKLRMLPPLIITTKEIDEGLKAIENSLKELYAEKKA